MNPTLQTVHGEADRFLAFARTAIAAGKFEDAETFYLAAVKTGGGRPQEHIAAGDYFRFAGHLDRAEAHFRAALLADPASHPAKTGLGQTLLAAGQYEEGWPLYEHRRQRRATPAQHLPFPEWHGEDLDGLSILFFTEQGHGDQIQCVRYVSDLKAAGAKVTVVCAPLLERLFRLTPADSVLPFHVGMEIRRHDYWALPFSVAGQLSPTLSKVDGSPYLTGLNTQEGRGLGFAWRGNPQHPNDARRSIFDPPNITGVDLLGIEGDFFDTAHAIAGLNAVVTVDTAVAHLAGAIGKRCAVLLPHFGTDWRWLRERSDTPWYASVQLFRQGAGETWVQVVERALADIS